MDEEVKGEGESQTVEPTAAELAAREQGWVPKEEFNGDEHTWIDAAEFLRRGPLFKKIDDQSKQLKDVKRALQEMAKLNADIRDNEYKRALTTLREQKRTALLEGDADAVIAADEKIELVREEQTQLKSQAQNQSSQEPELNPEFVQWTDRNSWYKNSAPMKAYADALGVDLARAGNTPAEVLRKVEIEVRKEFPNKFRNPNQDKPGSVESGSVKGAGGSSDNFQLTPEERRVMQTFVRTGALTEKEYIESLRKVRG